MRPGGPGIVDSSDRYGPLDLFTHYEHGKDADPTFKDLFQSATSIAEITPLIGSEVHGVQLSALSDKSKDQLALFTAQRRVVGLYPCEYASSPKD